MRSEIVKLRADNAVLSERLDGVELRGTPARSAPAPAGTAAAPRTAPDLEVVKLAPDAPEEEPEPLLSASDKPVVIRGSGSTATVDGVPSKPATSGPSQVAGKKAAPGAGAIAARPAGAAGGASATMARQSVKAVAP